MKELEQLVNDWARERGIYEYSSVPMQGLKLAAQAGKACDAVARGNRGEIIEELGDVLIAVANIAYMSGSDLYECLHRGFEKVKDQPGSLNMSGVWVKKKVA